MSTFQASPLERRARLLLLAYPADYLDERAEEMLGTLLEATPPGKEWPSARDAWSLLRGGIAARAARNRRVGLGTSLRQAATLGLALYVSREAADVYVQPRPYGPGPALLALLLGVTVLAVWTGRRAAVAAGAVGATVVLAWQARAHGGQPLYPDHYLPPWMVARDLVGYVPVLLALLALTALTQRGQRLPGSWLVLACLPLALLAAPGPLADNGSRVLSSRVTMLPAGASIMPDLFWLLAILALGWLVTDTRPALGVALSLVVAQLAAVIAELQTIVELKAPVTALWGWDSAVVETLGVATVMMAATLWILRRRTRARREAAS